MFPSQFGNKWICFLFNRFSGWRKYWDGISCKSIFFSIFNSISNIQKKKKMNEIFTNKNRFGCAGGRWRFYRAHAWGICIATQHIHTMVIVKKLPHEIIFARLKVHITNIYPNFICNFWHLTTIVRIILMMTLSSFFYFLTISDSLKFGWMNLNASIMHHNDVRFWFEEKEFRKRSSFTFLCFR